MAITTYTFPTNGKEFNISQLEDEITASTDILIGWTSVISTPQELFVTMKAELGANAQSALASIVAAHSPKLTNQTATLVALVENEKYAEDGLELSYRMSPRAFEIPAGDNNGEWHRFPISFPCTIMLLGGTVDLHAAMIGDEMKFETLCPTTIGYLTAPTVIGESMATLNTEASPYIFKGFDVHINGSVVGRTTCHSGSSFNMDTPWEVVYPAGTQVQISYTTIEPYRVTAAPLTLWISRDTDRGAIIKANQPMAFFYKNNTGTSKWVQICLEYHT